MRKTEIAAVLESAITATKISGPGAWSVNTGADYVQLVWSCDEQDAPEMYGDEPWSEGGGNAIIDASGVGGQDDFGSDAYVDKFGDEVICQWVQWDFDE